jgi:GLPGLI family protein
MKKIILSLSFAVVALFSANAQLAEGHVKYKIEMSSDNPDMEMAISMMQGSTLDVFFSGDKTRSDMKMGTMMNISTVNDGKDNILMLLSGMIGKNAIKSTISEIEAESGEKPEYDVELMDETKTIQNYVCKKALLTDPDGNEMTFWYTEDIIVNKKGQNYLNDEVPGFPMEFELSQGGMVMSMTVTELDKKLKKGEDHFDIEIPEGYKEMTLEQLKTMGM